MTKFALAMLIAVAALSPSLIAEAQSTAESHAAALKTRLPKDVPILEDIAVAKPDPQVPAGLAAFSGAWVGQWRGERTNAHMGDGLQVFEKMTPTSLTLVGGFIGRFTGRDGNYGVTYSGRTEHPTEFEGDALMLTIARNGNRVTYRIKDGRMTARLVMPNGGVWIGTFERVACCRE